MNARFHQCHGDNVLLLEDRTVAMRFRGFADALVFSERPLRSGEVFAVEVELKEDDWNGHLRLGLTTFVPSQDTPLPRYSLPDLARTYPSWVFAVSKKFMFEPLLEDCSRAAIQPDSALRPKRSCDYVTDPGSRLAVMYLAQGDTAQMYFISNGEDVRMCAESIPLTGPLYGVVDVYGKTSQVRLVPIKSTPTLLEAARNAIVSGMGYDGEGLREFVECASIPVHLKHYLLSHS